MARKRNGKTRERQSPPPPVHGIRAIGRWLYDNSLSIMFALLFLGSLALQSVSGYYSENARRTEAHKDTISYTEFLGTGTFLDGIFVNWQAATLQLAALIVFGAALRQKGASHSRDPETDEEEENGENGETGETGDDKDGEDEDQKKEREEKRQKERQEDRRWPWLYRNSLSIAFVVLFLGSMVAHIFFGTCAFNETRALTDDPPVSVLYYLRTGQFWFLTTQTWQAEFVAIFFFVVLSIFLRQEGSAESKPVGSSDKETGETNE